MSNVCPILNWLLDQLFACKQFVFSESDSKVVCNSASSMLLCTIQPGLHDVPGLRCGVRASGQSQCRHGRHGQYNCYPAIVQCQ